ncbi:MAG: tetratricopeptide repeat protein [Saprospiraceae bacterium]
MKTLCLLLCSILSISAFAQKATTYTDKKDNVHLCGPITISDLQEAPYAEWYSKNYVGSHTDSIAKSEWAHEFKNTSVDIYLGTWCGDSKKWVPRFIKLWESAGLPLESLNIIGLYNGDEKYKQGPNGEEVGKNIHRVPTFIFEQDGKETARIVESPNSDLLTDLRQIAMGIPPAPNYRGATHMIELLAKHTDEEITQDFKNLVNSTYRKVAKKSELNTLGYVYLNSGQIEKALRCFQFNTYYFKFNPNVFDSYAEALLESGDKEAAIRNYAKALSLDPSNMKLTIKLLELQEGFVANKD